MAHPQVLVVLFGVWAFTCILIGLGLVRWVPAITTALLGSVVGGVVGFLIGNADGPAEVPAYTTVGASVGLVVCGVAGVVKTSPRPPWEPIRLAASLVTIATPFYAAALTLLLQFACPLYVSGRRAGFCDFEGADLLGGWVSGVVVAFLFDAAFLAVLLLSSAKDGGLVGVRSRSELPTATDPSR